MINDELANAYTYICKLKTLHSFSLILEKSYPLSIEGVISYK